eukprot:UN01048
MKRLSLLQTQDDIQSFMTLSSQLQTLNTNTDNNNNSNNNTNTTIIILNNDEAKQLEYDLALSLDLPSLNDIQILGIKRNNITIQVFTLPPFTSNNNNTNTNNNNTKGNNINQKYK